MLNIDPAPSGHVVLPEPDFGRPGNGERIVEPADKKGGSRGSR